MTVLPAYKYGNPESIAISEENRIRDCRGCTRLSFDASGERIIAVCELRLKVGRKVERCSMYREKE